MRRISAFKYLSVFSLPVLAFISFKNDGWLTFLPVIFSFAFIPVLELFFPPDPKNISEAEEQVRRQDLLYDWLVYLIVPVQWLFLWLFLRSLQDEALSAATLVGRITAMGLLCGVMGINVAHELGHRKTRYERLMSRMLLLTSLYLHFYVEHNRGHHKRVSTAEDPASARYGETLYAFWVRSIWYSYWSVWSLEAERLKKKKKPAVSLSNEMLIFQIVQLVFVGMIGLFFGFEIMLCYLGAALMGILLLETVNYIEHYGLRRKKTAHGYERVRAVHSWNSDHIIGRMMLFELSRHSDHHYKASKKYQLLQHLEHSPQMPTGYPGMMVLATVPPIWFHLMNERAENAINNRGLLNKSVDTLLN